MRDGKGHGNPYVKVSTLIAANNHEKGNPPCQRQQMNYEESLTQAMQSETAAWSF